MSKAANQKRQAALAAVLSIIGGLVLLVALRKNGVTEAGIFIALLVLPMIVYGVASGMVSEFSAPGGWGAKFREMADNAVEVAPGISNSEIEIQPMGVVEKGSMAALSERNDALGSVESVGLTLQLGRVGYYAPRAVLNYAQTLLARDARLLVIFTDANGSFVASTSGLKLIAALGDGQAQAGQDLIDAIGMDDRAQVGELVGWVDASVSAGTTNATALKAMLDAGTSALVSVDGNGRPVGCVRRDDIVAKMLVTLAEG